MTVTIRLMSDWGLPPIYVDPGDGFYDLKENHEFQELFGVPDDVVAAIAAWNKLYSDIWDREDTPNSHWERPEDAVAFLERGRAVCRLLRRHVPPDVRIEYAGSDNIASEFY